MSTWIKRPTEPGWYWYSEGHGDPRVYQDAVPCQVFYANLHKADGPRRSRALYLRIWSYGRDYKRPSKRLSRAPRSARFLPMTGVPPEATRSEWKRWRRA